MSKFKVGDRVRLIDSASPEHHLDPNETYKVVGIRESYLHPGEHNVLLKGHDNALFIDRYLQLDQFYLNEQRIKKELGIE